MARSMPRYAPAPLGYTSAASTFYGDYGSDPFAMGQQPYGAPYSSVAMYSSSLGDVASASAGQYGGGVPGGAAPKLMPILPQAEGPPGCNLFVYQCPDDYVDENLAELFESFGNVVSAKIFIDPSTGRSKGFGVVSYDMPEAAEAAMTSMDGLQIGGKRLKVNLKKDRPRPY